MRSPATTLLACPICKGRLEERDSAVSCRSCGRRWPKRDGYVDFLTSGTGGFLGPEWRWRQEEMLAWYADLVANRPRAIDCFDSDYGCIEQFLGMLEGRVLDIGGGAGMTREYLRPDAEYINLDPSVEWLSSDWSSMPGRLRSLAESMAFVRGIGEELPFRDACFDVALSLWSLNHASDPEAALHEARRVLRLGGRLLLVLEDMEPTWRDLVEEPLRRRPWMAPEKLLSTLGVRGWPVQPDHAPITEGDLMRWAGQGFAVRQRGWVFGTSRAPYLVLELENSRVLA